MTKSTTALPRSPWSVGPSAWSVPSGAPPRACEGWGGGGPSPSGGGQRGPSSATARDGGEGVGHRIHDRRAERHEDGQHQGRRHHRDHDPARDVAPLGILAAHPRRVGRQSGGQVQAAHRRPFLVSHCASETMLISPGNRAKRTVTGSTRKTTGTTLVSRYASNVAKRALI